MRSPIILLLALTLTGLFSSSELAHSAEKIIGKTIQKTMKLPQGGKLSDLGVAPVALTTEECTKLGGKVVSHDGLCNSGKSCNRADEDGKFHAVCISKLK